MSTDGMGHGFYFRTMTHTQSHIWGLTKELPLNNQLEIAQSEQDVSPFCKESDMTYSWKRQIGLFLRQ